MIGPLGPLGAQEPKRRRRIGEVLEEVYSVLERRKRDRPEGSYTVKLLTGPEDGLLKKIAEESGEVIIAAKDHDNKQLTCELSDLLYHMMVVMVREGVGLSDIADEMAARRRK